MKLSPKLNIILLFSFWLPSLTAQEVRTPPATTLAELPASIPIDASTQADLSPEIETPDFEIESTQIKLIDVVEPPPMPGLPPVEGTMTLKIHSVVDPGLPEIPEHSPALPEELATGGEVEPVNSNLLDMGIVSISATVYDHSRTLLTCNMGGGIDKTITAWSNIDFNHFSGIGNFEAKGADGKTRSYMLLMSSGDETTDSTPNSATPKIPAIPNGTPAFVIETINPDPDSVKLLEDLHALYRDEGKNMAEATAAREKAEAEKRAYLLANPPKPKDVTVYFWKHEVLEEAPQTEGGQP